uniref:EGF-like domain-containing protein n=1 Tax=Parascaris univalens TaxID=6257 RepID=A0A915C7P0_PARUN
GGCGADRRSQAEMLPIFVLGVWLSSIQSHSRLDAQSIFKSIDTQQTTAHSLLHIFGEDQPGTTTKFVDDYAFIRPDQPFKLSCPKNFSFQYASPSMKRVDLNWNDDDDHHHDYDDSALYWTYATEGDIVRCVEPMSDTVYRYTISYKNCSSPICKNGGACVEKPLEWGISYYECHCPYKTRGLECDERYQGIEWLVALLWAAVLGEVTLMVVALCRHKHQRYYCGIANKKRFVDVLNDSKKDVS